MSWSSGEKLSVARLKRLSGSIPASYTIFNDNDTYYAEATSPSGTHYDDTDLADLLNNYVISAGRHIHLAEGEFNFSSPIQYVNNLHITGSGYDVIDPPTQRTLLKTNSDFSGTSIFEPADATARGSGFVLENVALYATDTATKGVDLQSQHESLLRNVSVDMSDIATSIGIHLRYYSTTQTCNYNRVENCHIRNVKYGVYVEGGSGGPGCNVNTVCGGAIHAGDIGDSGVYVASGTASDFTAEHVSVEGDFTNGFYLGYGGSAVIRCYVELTNATSYGVSCDSNNNYVVFNQIAAQTKNIIVQSGKYRNLIVTTYDTDDIQDDGIHTWIVNLYRASLKPPQRTHPTLSNVAEGEWYYCTTHRCMEYKNQSTIGRMSGTGTITNGTSSVKVAHGMGGAPTSVNATGTHEETRDLIVTSLDSDADGTKFTVATGDGANVTDNRGFYWIAWSRK